MYRHRNISKRTQQKHLAAKIEISKDLIVDLVDAKLGPGSNCQLYDFAVLKDKLGETKTKLDPYWNLAQKNKHDPWNKFQNIIDIYKPMRFDIEKRFNAVHVTNAWLKYWEIYSQYNLIPPLNERKFKAFFNAELPGAALCAFNHFMKTMRKGIDFDWRASSLAPDSTTKNAYDALGDTYGLYTMNKDKWLMSLDNTSNNGHRRNNGDVTNFDNIADFAAQIGPESEFGGVDLYSHDAGIDVSDDFNAQEISNARIHLGCALAGFMTLRIGGAFVAKQYTFFETFTWELILIYASLFDEFYICKPLTSRPYNSEIYLVGKGFRGLPENVKNVLMNKLTNFSMESVISEDMTKVLLSQQLGNLTRFARIVFNQQIDMINENIHLYNQFKGNLNGLQSGLNELKHNKEKSWLGCYPVSTIGDQDQLPSII